MVLKRISGIFFSKDLSLAGRQNACMRFAYRGLLDGKDKNTLKRELQRLFDLNSRYVGAKAILQSTTELAVNSKKAVFGRRDLFERPHKRPTKLKKNLKDYSSCKAKCTFTSVIGMLKYAPQFMIGYNKNSGNSTIL